MPYRVTDTIIVDQNRNLSSIGIATFAGPVLIGGGSSTGTVSQPLQVTGSNSAYIGGNLGIGSTNPSSKLSVIGDATFSGIVTSSGLNVRKDPGTGIATDFTNSLFGNGWRLSAPGSTTYYLLATLPVGSTGNTFDHLRIEGTLGAWTNDNQTTFDIIFSNRNAFDYKYISYGSVRSDVRIIGISTNSTIQIWAQHQASAFTKLVYNITESVQAIVVSNPTSTTTAPVGTTVFDSSTITPRFIINESDNIGIGTINPTSKLAVQGDVSIASTLGIGTVIDIIPYDTLNSGTLSFEGSAGQLFSITNNLSSGSIFSVNDISGIPSIDVDANGTIELAPFGGNVGVGTTNPTSKLHVVGNVLVSGGAYFDGVGVATGSIGVGITNPQGTIDIRTAPQWSISNFGANLVIGGTRNNAIGILDFTNSNPWAISNNSGALYFSQMPVLGNTASGPTTRAVIDTSGNVLIPGTAATGTASQRLQVTGGAYVSTALGIGRTNPGVYALDVNGIARIGSASGGKISVGTGMAAGEFGLQILPYSDRIELQGEQQGTSFRPLILQPFGSSVGIGTTTPSQTLHVQGNARVTGAVYDSSNSPGTSGQVLQSTVTGTQWTTTVATAGGSGKFDTEINNVLYVQPTGTLDIVGVGTTTTQITTLPASPPEYIIHSIHVTNISNGDAEITAGFVMNARKVPASISVSVGSSGGAGIHTFTVGSASSITVGMAVTGTGNIGETTGIGATAGFQYNTYVTSVDGNNITLSKPMSGYATGILHFSPVSDVVSRLPVPVGSAVELLKQPMILGGLDSIVLQSTGAGSGIGSTSTAAISQTANSNFLTVTAGAAITNFIASGMLIQGTGTNTGIQTNTFVGVGYTPGSLIVPMTRPATTTASSQILSFTEVVVPQDGALQATIVYQSSTDTSYQNGTGTVVGIVTLATQAVSGITSTVPNVYYGTGNLYPSTIQSIRVSNISDGTIYPGGDYPVWVGIGNSDTIFSWLAYNMVIPRNSSIELCEAPKRLGIGQSIFAYSNTPNAIEIQIAGKQKI